MAASRHEIALTSIYIIDLKSQLRFLGRIVYTQCINAAYTIATDVIHWPIAWSVCLGPPRKVTRRRCGLLPNYCGHMLDMTLPTMQLSQKYCDGSRFPAPRRFTSVCCVSQWTNTQACLLVLHTSLHTTHSRISLLRLKWQFMFANFHSNRFHMSYWC